MIRDPRIGSSPTHGRAAPRSSRRAPRLVRPEGKTGDRGRFHDSGFSGYPNASTAPFRAWKKDLDDRLAGKLSAEDLRKRIEIAEY
jgi:hypothetical protein